ncbi:MAG: hypothetical protein E7062_06540 [Spirochaetaceae bacterium]|nr:hypothetical protein [Spirochaetaceae bacterium]
MDFKEKKSEDLILQFVDKSVLDAFSILSSEDDSVPSNEIVIAISEVFCAGNSDNNFTSIIASGDSNAEEKLNKSFHNNLKLLVEKTWVEPSDITVKEQVLYQIDKLCEKLELKKYVDSYSAFINVINDVVYLMFGPQSKKDDFPEYALRIDPEFGIFWWYVQSLPKDPCWSNEKSRFVILLGMYFLANY